MRKLSSNTVLFALLVASAGCVLCFRYFTTVDGPLHVLRASLLDASLTTQGHVAHGLVYDTTGWTWRLGDLTLAAMLRVWSPERAHDVFAALVNLLVLFSATAFIRAHGTRSGIALLWLCPFTLSFTWVMGLFHFMLGVAVGLYSIAWWKRHGQDLWKRWTGLLIGLLLAWYTHRSAPIILSICFLVSLSFELTERRTFAQGRRKAFLLLVTSVAGVLLVGALVQRHLLSGIHLPIPNALPSFDGDLLMRPLVLLDREQERWTTLPIAVLMLIGTCAGAWARFRMGSKLFGPDVLFILCAIFMLNAWLFNTPEGRQLLMAERSQWLALLFLALWLAAVAGADCTIHAKIIATTALFVLPIHLVRIVGIERSLHLLRPVHENMLQAGRDLKPKSLVLAVTVGRNALLQHIEAYTAVRHSGILLTGDKSLPVRSKTGTMDPQTLGMAMDPYWVARHWRKGLPASVDHVLFLGEDIDRNARAHPWPVLLGQRFSNTFENRSARIYSDASSSLETTARTP